MVSISSCAQLADELRALGLPSTPSSSSKTSSTTPRPSSSPLAVNASDLSELRWETRQAIFLTLLTTASSGSTGAIAEALQELVHKRKAARKAERALERSGRLEDCGLLPEYCRREEDTFRQAFMAKVVEELEHQRAPKGLCNPRLLLKDKALCLQAIDFLMARHKSRLRKLNSWQQRTMGAAQVGSDGDRRTPSSSSSPPSSPSSSSSRYPLPPTTPSGAATSEEFPSHIGKGSKTRSTSKSMKMKMPVVAMAATPPLRSSISRPSSSSAPRPRKSLRSLHEDLVEMSLQPEEEEEERAKQEGQHPNCSRATHTRRSSTSSKLEKKEDETEEAGNKWIGGGKVEDEEEEVDECHRPNKCTPASTPCAVPPRSKDKNEEKVPPHSDRKSSRRSSSAVKTKARMIYKEEGEEEGGEVPFIHSNATPASNGKSSRHSKKGFIPSPAAPLSSTRHLSSEFCRPHKEAIDDNEADTAETSREEICRLKAELAEARAMHEALLHVTTKDERQRQSVKNSIDERCYRLLLQQNLQLEQELQRLKATLGGQQDLSSHITTLLATLRQQAENALCSLEQEQQHVSRHTENGGRNPCPSCSNKSSSSSSSSTEALRLWRAIHHDVMQLQQQWRGAKRALRVAQSNHLFSTSEPPIHLHRPWDASSSIPASTEEEEQEEERDVYKLKKKSNGHW